MDFIGLFPPAIQAIVNSPHLSTTCKEEIEAHLRGEEIENRK